MYIKSSKSSESNTLSNKLKERFGERLKENCSLATYVRSGVGGVAEYLVEAENVDDITSAFQIAQTARRPCAIIGGGTSTVASHVGSLGLVVVNTAAQIYFAEHNSLVVVESGVTNSSLVTAAASKGLGGLEFLIGIPGTIGGAVATNATYQGRSLKSFVKSIVCWVADGSDARVTALSYAEMEELLRHSSKSTNMIGPVILSVHLQFSRLYPDEILRRLGEYRHRSEVIAARQSIVGRPFEEILGQYPLLLKDIERLRRTNMRYDSKNDVIRASRLPVQPVEIRTFTNVIKETAAGQGVTLADRLTYLGYWPDEGADESN